MINKKNIYGLPFTNTFINSSTKTIYMENIFAQNLEVRKTLSSKYINLLDGSLNNVQYITNQMNDIFVVPKDMLSLFGNLNLNYYNIINVSEIKSDEDIKLDTSNVIISDDLIVNKDLYVYGAIKTVGDSAVTFNNNVIELNDSFEGIPDSSLNSGLIINRGELENFNILYNEESQTLKIGYDDNLQSVAVREDYPINNGVVVWDDNTKSFITTRGSYIFDDDRFLITNKLEVEKNVSISGELIVEKKVEIKGDFEVNQNITSDGFIKNNFGYVSTQLGTGSDMFPEHSTNKSLNNIIGENKYRGGVLSQNGKIYCIPFESYNILVINVKNNSLEYIDISYNGYSGGIITNNGNIYCAPYTPNNNKILVINTNNNNITYIEIENIIDNYQWSSCTLYDDKIIFIPFSHKYFMILNTTNNNIEYVDSNLIENNKWSGGVLSPEGKIFCIPYNSNKIAIFNPETYQIDFLENIIIDNQNAKWNSGVLAQNGFIYTIPSNSNKILIINSYTLKIKYIELNIINNINDNLKWYGGSLSTNGLIYMMPYNNDKLLIIDPTTETFLMKNNIGDNNNDWVGSVLVPNGKIYGIPCNNESVLIIKTGYPILLNWMISPEFNKL